MTPILDLKKVITGIEEHVEKATAGFDKFYVKKPEFHPYIASGAVDVYLNPYVLADAIRSAAIDIDRWASFHLEGQANPCPDRHKYAGFVSKWVAQFRPLSFHMAGDEFPPLESPVLLSLNAVYAFYLFRSYLDLGPKNNQLELDKLEAQVIYRLHFRGNETGENLAVLAYCYELIANLPEGAS